MLAVAREPVYAEQIRQLASIRGDEGVMVSAIGRMRPFLLLHTRKYRLFHATMQAFLTGVDTARDHPEFAVSSATWHAGSPGTRSGTTVLAGHRRPTATRSPTSWAT
jgi:hypothetical protein